MFLIIDGGPWDGLHAFVGARYVSEWIQKHLSEDVDIWYSYSGKAFVSVYDFPYY